MSSAGLRAANARITSPGASIDASTGVDTTTARSKER